MPPYRAVLPHFEPGHGDATAVGSLAGRVPDGSAAAVASPVGLEHVDGGLLAAHVGALGHEAHAGRHERLGLGAADLVLRRARQRHVHAPDVGPGSRVGEVHEPPVLLFLLLFVLDAVAAVAVDSVAVGSVAVDSVAVDSVAMDSVAVGMSVGVTIDVVTVRVVPVAAPAAPGELRQRPAPLLEGHDGLDVGARDALTAPRDQRALRVRERHDGAAQLHDLERRVLGHVARARDGHALARPAALARVLEHVGDVVDEAVAGRLCSLVLVTPSFALPAD